MNKRLRQFEKESKLEIFGLGARRDIWEAALEKYAELIVAECTKAISDGRFSDTECEGNSHRVSYNNGRYGASSDIKKHFGVEQ